MKMNDQEICHHSINLSLINIYHKKNYLCMLASNVKESMKFEISPAFGSERFTFRIRIPQANTNQIFLDVMKAPKGKIKVKYCISYSQSPNVHIIDGFEFTNDAKILNTECIRSIFIESPYSTLYYPNNNGFSITNARSSFSDDIEGYVNIFISAMCNPFDEIEKNYSNQLLQSILFDDKFHDLIIKVGSREFKVHKNIVTAASPVFRAILMNDTLEKKENCITIPDFDVEVMTKVIEFIYSGFIEIPDCDLCYELLRVSDKYDIKHLKSFTSDYLKTQISRNNLLSILLIANVNNAKELEEYCFKFFSENRHSYETSEFAEILNIRPELLPKLLSLSTNF